MSRNSTAITPITRSAHRWTISRRIAQLITSFAKGAAMELKAFVQSPYALERGLQQFADWRTKATVGYAQVATEATAALSSFISKSPNSEHEIVIPNSFLLGKSTSYKDPRPDEPVVFTNGQLQELSRQLADAAEGLGLVVLGVGISPLDRTKSGLDLSMLDPNTPKGVVLRVKVPARQQSGAAGTYDSFIRSIRA
jgi:hypothetical protein